MANTTILTLAEYKAWANPSMDTSRDTELQLAINAAAAWMKRVARWDIEEASVTFRLDGRDAQGRVLTFPQRYRPVIHVLGDLVTIAEDGVAVSVSTGTGLGDSTPSDGVILHNANTEFRCEAIKFAGSWRPGYQNVEISCTAGYAAAAIPLDLKQLCAEVAMLFFRSPAWIGKSSKSTGSGSVAFHKELTPPSQATFERLAEGVV